MSNNLSNLIFRDLANKSCTISDYDFYRLLDFIKFQKSEFALDLLFISFTTLYNEYLDKIKSFKEINEIDTYKDQTSMLSYRCKSISSLIEEFDIDMIKIFHVELKNLISTLFTNEDTILSVSFCNAFSKINPLYCLKLLRKNKNKLNENLINLLNQLEQEYEQYEQLSYEVESIINSNISDFKYDFPVFNYLDFI